MPFAIIMAGGLGERLWPLSTKQRPKQFLQLIGEQTMLQATVARILPAIPFESIYVVVGNEYQTLVLEQLPELPPQNLITEPMGRGTAACVGLSALAVTQVDPEGVMIVLPADHVIKREGYFRTLLKKCTEVAVAGTHLITLGIPPNHPATGYGYIHAVKPWQGQAEALEVERFTEKPDRKTAERFLSHGGYFWNSGMFIWRADTILEEIRAHMPELYAGLMKIRSRLGREDYAETVEQVYRELEATSIDYGVMEKSQRVLVLPARDIGWSDLGDWSALSDILGSDQQGNAIQANHVGIDTKQCLIFSQRGKRKGKRLATLGVSNLVIVDTEDALLVMKRDRSQDVKRLATKATTEEKT